MDRNANRATEPHDHTHCQSEALSRADTLCHERGARLTALRRKVLELIWNSHQPIGAYAILDHLRNGNRGAAPPTVYRALDFLMEQGLIHKLESLNAFIGCDHPENRHASQFLICTNCHGAVEIQDTGISNAVKKSAGAAGFTVSHLTIELQGLCPNCGTASGDQSARQSRI